MVAIKIQSAEDIVGAFLSEMGIEEKGYDKIVAFLVDAYHKSSGQDIMSFLTQFAKRKAQQYFADENLDAEQQVALIKYLFLTQNLSTDCGYDFFCGQEKSLLLQKNIDEHRLFVVPQYKYANMPTQVFVTPKPKSILRTVLHHKKIV